MAAATSSGVPARCIGEASAASASAGVADAVAIQPGPTALTVMPSAATSTASERARPAMAALAVA